MNELLEAALTYSEKSELSVIPVKPDKKPYIKWEDFQKSKATSDEIKVWWNRWPSANIGIVTGSISGIVVVDVDNDEGREAIQKYIPDSLITPACRTPKGGQHLYFRAPEKTIFNNSRAVPGCDFRGEGGYVIAPPSKSGGGKAYTWLEGLSLDEVEPASLPEPYISFINSYAFKRDESKKEAENNRQHLTTSDHNLFTLGRRDNDLFHLANCLVKGGMPVSEIQEYLEFIAKCCLPPFPFNEANIKIKSALDRAARRERNLTQEIRDWVMTTSGNFLTTDVYIGQHLTTREEKKKCVVILHRLVEEGIIEKYGNKNGCFRRVENECEDIDFFNANDTALSIRYPFGEERYVLTLPKNVIVIAGAPNAGKTAYLLNLAKMNMRNRKVYYFSSEMGDLEFKKRLSKFDLPLKQWSFVAKERASNFADVIRPDDINIIDFLEVYDEFYKMGLYIKEIYDKLQKGIAIIAIQKNLNTDYGLGGMRGLEKARLYLSMETGKIKIVKAKNWAGQENPNGLTLDFKLVQGCKFITLTDWRK